MLRNLRDRIKRWEAPLFVITALLGVYLALANVLKAAKWPSENIWTPWHPLFVILLFAAVYVPLYAFYKALDAYFEQADKHTAEADMQAAQRARARTQLRSDLALLCQQVVAAIADRCAHVAINELATHVWACRDDGSFDELAAFHLPGPLLGIGINWSRGKGVAGMAWQRGLDLRADMRPLLEEARKLGPADFDRMSPEQRHGLTAEELEHTARYTGVCAIRLFSADPAARLLAIFVIAYAGEHGFDCIADESSRARVSTCLAAAARLLNTTADAV